jgi:hypothetical protein
LRYRFSLMKVQHAGPREVWGLRSSILEDPKSLRRKRLRNVGLRF